MANRPLPYQLHRNANREILAAAMWYLEQSDVAASRFIQAIEDAINRIREFPMVGRESEQHVRRFVVKPFPYELIYIVHEEFVQIVACAHASRQPDYWIDRLDDE